MTYGCYERFGHCPCLVVKPNTSPKIYLIGYCLETNVLSEGIGVYIKGFYTKITDTPFVGARHAVPLRLLLLGGIMLIL